MTRLSLRYNCTNCHSLTKIFVIFGEKGELRLVVRVCRSNFPKIGENKHFLILQKQVNR